MGDVVMGPVDAFVDAFSNSTDELTRISKQDEQLEIYESRDLFSAAPKGSEHKDDIPLRRI